MPTSKNLRPFLSLILPFLLFGFWFVLNTEKGTLVRFFALHRTPLWNEFFRYLTYLGDGLMVGVVCLIALLVRYRYSLILLVVGLGQLVLSAFFKRVVFGNMPRPRWYFEGQIELGWLIEGVDVHTHYSFPSGHTITAFGLALFISMMVDKKWVTIACTILAIAVGLSRVYLFQHFLEDVLMGSVIGTVNTALIFYAFANWRTFWDSYTLSTSLLGTKGLSPG